MTAATVPAGAVMLRRLVDVFNSAGVPYCFLHGYVGFPDRIASDVDCLVSADLLPRALPRLLHRRRAEVGGRIVQWLQHESTAHYFVLAADDPLGCAGFLAFDASSDFRARGRPFYTGAEILAGRRARGDFWIPAPAHEFGYYLVKRIGKGALEPGHQRRLSELYTLDPSGCKGEIARFWTGGDVETLTGAAESSRWESVIAAMPGLRHRLLAPRSPGGLASWLRYRAKDAVRRMQRWRRPTGLHVVLLGPDGVGKSSVVEQLRRALAPAFRRTAAGHFGPDLLGRAAARGSTGAETPHAHAVYGGPMSLLKAGYWLFDFTVGYWVRIRPALVRSTLVVFDRYLPDALVDAKRYRFGGSRRLLQAICRLVPQPDLVILLDAPADVVRTRKQEVNPAETERQRTAYQALLATLPNAYRVDAGRPLDEVVGRVASIVLDCLARRTAARLRLGE